MHSSPSMGFVMARSLGQVRVVVPGAGIVATLQQPQLNPKTGDMLNLSTPFMHPSVRIGCNIRAWIASTGFRRAYVY